MMATRSKARRRMCGHVLSPKFFSLSKAAAFAVLSDSQNKAELREGRLSDQQRIVRYFSLGSRMALVVTPCTGHRDLVLIAQRPVHAPPNRATRPPFQYRPVASRSLPRTSPALTREKA